ncbi:MAG: hypothetical protein RLO50_16520 [Azospirillaceae bacterium]
MSLARIGGLLAALTLLGGCSSPLVALLSQPEPEPQTSTAAATQPASTPPAAIASGGTRFAPANCGIAVDFPAAPQEVSASGPQPRARLSQAASGGDAFFVAACQPGLQISEANAQQILGGLVIDAEMTDYQGASVQTGAGRGFAIQGSGPRNGVTYRYQYVLVPGPTGTLIVSIAAPSGSFPPSGGTAFFESLRAL